jgi:hypothetical protein
MDEKKPGPVEWSVGSGLAVAAIVTGVLTRNWLICLLLVGLLLLLAGGYLAWRLWKRRHSEKNFSGEMEQQSGNLGVRKAEQKAQLDQLRRAFQEGIQVYKKRKKDVYSVPWYLMIGTSGSGKTEAIRHSEIGFPPGLTDPLAGVGGTINMNWWFTNYGVILDTAGKMVFPESGAGQSSEWDEFLKLLRKHRPACPINGLFLALDVDKMIKDLAGEISKKASDVHKQLDCIQRALDVRFPVYLLVTKSDFLTGFKEYFDGIDDPQLQNQVVGWSNQAPLDDPVDPDAIERDLLELVERIKRRRLAVVRNPVNLDLQNGRLDCTDAMFAFPASLERLIPRLKRYLQIVFSTGQFSSKPVFLRGIYFTSSMQQNGDLDEALAEFMGLKVTELPPANVQENAKSYFLRDLFIDKAFREQLVTSASNTRRMRRNRLFILGGLAFLVLGTLVTFSLLGYRSYDRAVGAEERLWQEGSNQWEQPSYAPGSSFWHPLVVLTNDDQWRYAGNDHPFTNFPDATLAQFHVMLENSVSHSSNNVPLIFRPLRGLRRDLKFAEGQRVLVEHSVLLPLWESARYKMSEIKPANLQDTEAAIRLRKALACLVQTEADIDAGPRALPDGRIQDNISSFAESLLQFVVETNVSADSNLVAGCAWTYSSEGAGKNEWPPKILSGGTNLASDGAIDNGLQCLIAQVRKNQQQVEDHLLSLTAVCSNLVILEKAENTLSTDARNDCALTPDDFAAWRTAAEAYQSSLKQAGMLGVLDTSAPGAILQTAVSKIELENTAASSEAFTEILRGAEGGIQAGKRPLFADIKAKCQESAGSMQSQVEGALVNYRRYLSNWDANFLGSDDSGGKSYFEQRNNLYLSASSLRNPNSDVQVGTLAETLKNWQADLDKISGQAAKYKGPLSLQVKQISECAIADANKGGQNALLSNYFDKTGRKLNVYYKSTSASFPALMEACKFMSDLDKDLQLTNSPDLPPAWQDKLGNGLAQQYEGPAKATLMNVYAKSCENSLNQEAGFPVILASLSNMTSEQVAALKDTLSQLAGEFKQIQDSGEFSGLDAFRLITERVALMSKIVTALAPGSDVSKNQISASPGSPGGAENQCPYAHLTIEGQYARLNLDRASAAPLPHLAGSLEIKVSNKPDPDDTGATIYYRDHWDSWGVLNLIKLPDVKCNEGKYIVPLPVKNSDGSSAGHVNVELDFDPPLPSLEVWRKLNPSSS